MKTILDEENLIKFMDSLGWIYGAYDDQHFHKFSGGNNNSISNRAAQELYDSFKQQQQDLLDAVLAAMPERAECSVGLFDENGDTMTNIDAYNLVLEEVTVAITKLKGSL